MVIGDIVLFLVVLSFFLYLLDNSFSNFLSFLSEVEDKYGDYDELDFEMKDDESNVQSIFKRNGVYGVLEFDFVLELDEDSKLFEVDVNDFEVEIERLFDIFFKNGVICDIVNVVDGVGI